ncbi:PfkB family carbohydrate kinase [Thiohalobacter sp. IOR34]|uniref:PfkB family carbohydrate kinase n=1 Tax=Thiohalobacter sp. IOR34 TaxID=3057176 RepID=UPI0025B11A1C|nr:PfkB family carbohydrate kinase [Thiohalobacter sp. IOR34]WJW74601.1 PfkB family carbohydrate kinase [Thiohalobacter sp. IOR34]
MDLDNTVRLKQKGEAHDPTPPATRKILPLEVLADRAQALRQQGRRLVLCHGTFDLLHIGHVRHLQRARQEGDVLMVTVTADAHVNKGPDRPVFPQALRAENLAALECVDLVAINHAETAVNVLEALRPDVYVKGSDYAQAADDLTGNIRLERAAVERHGGRIFFTQEITSSSTRLLNDNFGVFPEETRTYLDRFKAAHSLQDVLAALRALGRLKVLVVGDAIIDEYHYTTSLGQTGKGNVLAVRYQNEERFAGGAIAVANHIAGFAGEVTLLCGLGGRESHEDFIRSRLNQEVRTRFLINPEARTLVKRRYIGDDDAKLFEVYFHDRDVTSPELGAEACDWLAAHLQDFDAVVVPDFGNGFIDDGMVSALSGAAPFLAVNTQLNSGNRGYHVITRYPRADFVSLNEPELRMAASDRSGSIEALAERIAGTLGCRQLAVTRGTRGVAIWDGEAGRMHRVPALASRVVDRIGAGDAFLSLAGLAAAAGLPADLAAFIGSVAAALDVQIVCNRSAISPIELQKYVTTLLK